MLRQSYCTVLQLPLPRFGQLDRHKPTYLRIKETYVEGREP